MLRPWIRCCWNVQFLLDARDHLLQAQEQVKLFYDAKHTTMPFSVGDWVWVKLLHRPVASLPGQPRASSHRASMAPIR